MGDDVIQALLKQNQELINAFKEGMTAMSGRQEELSARLDSVIELSTKSSKESQRNESTFRLFERIPIFKHVPEDGFTFGNWLNRYEDILQSDARDLSDADRARLVVSKLDTKDYLKFEAHIMPKKPSQLSLEEVTSTLKELFGHISSVFVRRYRYLQVRCDNDSEGTFDDYTGLVNKRHELANM